MSAWKPSFRNQIAEYDTPEWYCTCETNKGSPCYRCFEDIHDKNVTFIIKVLRRIKNAVGLNP